MSSAVRNSGHRVVRAIQEPAIVVKRPFGEFRCIIARLYYFWNTIRICECHRSIQRMQPQCFQSFADACVTRSHSYMSRFTGKVALVTGSTQGLGLGIADRLIREGAAVVLNGRSPERGARVLEELRPNGGRIAFIAADVGIKGDAERVVCEAAGHFGR